VPAAAYLVYQVLLELLDEMVNQVTLVCQALLDSPVGHQQYAKRSPHHHADHVHLDLQDQPVLRDPPATLDDLVTQVDLAMMVLLETLDLKAHQVHLGTLVEMALLVLPEPQRNQHPIFPVTLAAQAKMALQVYLVTQAQTVDLEVMAILDPKDPRDPLVLLVNQVEMAILVPLANLVVLEKKVSVPNIAHWMEEFSSQMELDDKSKIWIEFQLILVFSEICYYNCNFAAVLILFIFILPLSSQSLECCAFCTALHHLLFKRTGTEGSTLRQCRNLTFYGLLELSGYY